MGSWEVLVDKGSSIDGEATFTSGVGDITTLDDKTVDDSVEFSIEVMQFGVVSFSILTST